MDPGGIGDRLEAADGVPDPIKKVKLRCWNVTKHEIQFTVSVTILNNVLNYNWTVNTALKLNVKVNRIKSKTHIQMQMLGRCIASVCSTV